MKKISEVWPQWSIVEKIGTGTYGIVYKAKREERGNISYAAIKVIHIPQNKTMIEDLKNSGMEENSISNYFNTMVDNLLDEIKIMESLKSANNIVGIEDYQVVVDDNGFNYKILIRMELLKDLRTYLNEKVLSTKEIVQLGMDICQALISCHCMNIIHRDIKIGNIFVNKFGSFKLGDFGIAKQMEMATQDMSHKGTNMYMAPEVFNGKEYNHTVDLYSLGLVLYRLLNHGRLPFLPPIQEEFDYQEQTNAMLRRIAGEELPPPANVDKELADIILKACAYRSEERYNSAKDMYDKLKGYYNSKNFESDFSEDIYDEPKTTVIDLANVVQEKEKTEKSNKGIKERIVNKNEKVLTDEIESKTGERDNRKLKWIIAVGSFVILLTTVLIVTIGYGIYNKEHEPRETVIYENDSLDNGLEICISGTTVGRHYRSVQITRETEEFYYLLKKGKIKKISLENSAPDICSILEESIGRFKVRGNKEGTGIIKLKIVTEEDEILIRKLFISVYARLDNYYGKTNKRVNVYRGATDNGDVGNDEPKSALYEDTKVKIIASCDEFYLIKLLDGTVFSDDRSTGYVLKNNIDIENN